MPAVAKPKRVIFAIYGGRAALSKDGTTLSHVAYMVQQGILKGPSDPSYDQVVRGYLQLGQLHILQGSQLFVTKLTPDLRGRLRQISQQLNLDKSKPVKVATYSGAHLGRPVTTPKLTFVPWQIWKDEEIKVGGV